MTVRFLALYETPADPEAFDRHYARSTSRSRRLPGLRRYTVGRDVTAVRGGAVPPDRRAGMGHHGGPARRVRLA